MKRRLPVTQITTYEWTYGSPGQALSRRCEAYLRRYETFAFFSPGGAVQYCRDHKGKPSSMKTASTALFSFDLNCELFPVYRMLFPES